MLSRENCARRAQPSRRRLEAVVIGELLNSAVSSACARFQVRLLGRETTDDCGIVTVYIADRNRVDTLYDRLDDCARDPPEENDQYDVYQFFAEDPDGRTVEVQTFLHPLPD